MEQAKHNKVKFTGGFWKHFEDINRVNTIPRSYEQCHDTGRIDALKLEWREGMPNKPHHFWDSDVAKWMEAASFSLMKRPDDKLEKQIDDIVNLIEKGQASDGYFNSYFQQIEPTSRWHDLRIKHELYCAGHLIEAAVAYYEATGKKSFINLICRYADYIDSVFGPEDENKIPGYPGHEEIELALVKLYNATNNEKYLKLSKFFIDERGKDPNYFIVEKDKYNLIPLWENLADAQAHIPVREQKEAVGHAVRAGYLYSGMADVFRETGDKTLFDTCRNIWENIIHKKMYITGGIGSCYDREDFTNNYDLPNEEAYAETCAAISLIFFAHRMFKVDKKSEYIDVLERALYNGASSGISLDGKNFFYVNPLASYPDGKLANGKKHEPRPDWFNCSCCPPNVARLRASLGQYFYDYNENTIWVNLYNNSTTEFALNETKVELIQTSEYPWDGKVLIEVNTVASSKFEIALRLPGWCSNPSIELNGDTIDLNKLSRDAYVYIERIWTSGDKIELDLPMPVEIVRANPKVRHDCGRIALTRGPIVYCIEEEDNGKDLNAVELLSESHNFETKYEKNLLDGIVAIYADAQKVSQDKWDGSLYSTQVPEMETCKIKAIPYYAWGNRKFGEMLVWIRESKTKSIENGG